MSANKVPILLFLAAIVALPAFGALTVAVTGVTQTNAFLQERGSSGACTIAVSTDPTFTSPATIPDFNGTEYSGASTDTGRADTVTWSDGTVSVIVGHNVADRALSTATAYYYKVSGCGTTVTGSFTTPTVGNGTTQNSAIPWSTSNTWNYAYPSVNLLTRGWMTDPVTGVQLQPLNNANDRGWRTGATSSGQYTTFQNWVNNSWTGLPALTSPFPTTTSTVTTNGTTALDLYGIFNRFESTNADAPFYGISFDDLGLILWGSATGTGTNAEVTACVFTSPTAGCLGTPITITLPAGYAQVAGSSTDADGAFPCASCAAQATGTENFPTPFFSGWGLTASLGPDHVNTEGTLSCAMSVCTISSPTQFSHFPNTMAAGQKIYIAGSSPTCTNNLCTLASGGYTNAGQITIVENPSGISGAAFIVYMWGLRIQKVSATGSVTVGAAFKWAGSIGISQPDATYPVFNPHGFTSGDGHYGFLVETALVNADQGTSTMYFVSGDGTIRNIWNQNIWTDSSCYASTNTADLPNSIQPVFYGQASPDPTDPRTWYVTSDTGINGVGPIALFKIKYNGDTTENLSTSYGFDQGGDGFTINPPCGYWSITNLTPASTTPAMDIPDQIANNWASVYNNGLTGTTGVAFYGNGWAFSGVTGSYATFNNSYGTSVSNPSGQNNAAWIAVVNLSTGLVVNLIHTLDGTGTTGYYNGIRWGGLHNVMDSAFTSEVIIDNNSLSANDTGALFAGPFEVTPSAILEADGVTWNTNTCLDWPISGGSGFCASESYDTACPAGNPYVFLGASSPNCVTFKFPGQPCNISPGAKEQAAVPVCSWDTSYTQPVSFAVGDNFVQAQGDDGDYEHFRVLSVTVMSGYIVVVAQRNAVPDYCGFDPTYLPGYPNINNGMQAASYLMHSNGWIAHMMPPRLNGCNTGQFFLNPATGTVQENGHILSINHGEIAPGLTAGLLDYLTFAASKVNAPATNLFPLPTTYLSFVGPTFQGTNANIGGNLVQSYFKAPGLQAWGVDTNALNPQSGGGPESNYNNIGSRTLSHVTGNIYTITLTGATASNANYKNFPLLGWAGRYLLGDVSGPSSLVDSTPWSMCYVYKAGECHAGSTAGVIYVNVPGAYDAGSCLTGQSFLINPCVAAGLPGGGGVRQQNLLGSDITGQGSRVLSYLLSTPGELYPYSEFAPSPDGTFGVAAAHHIPGWTLAEWVVKLPPWNTDASNRTIAAGMTVTVPPGLAYARVAFGYSRYIGATTSPVGNLYCTPRTEECVTSTNVSPFAFETSDTSTAASCASGCPIQVPWVAGNAGWYRVDRSANDSTWVTGTTIPVAIQ